VAPGSEKRRRLGVAWEEFGEMSAVEYDASVLDEEELLLWHQHKLFCCRALFHSLNETQQADANSLYPRNTTKVLSCLRIVTGGIVVHDFN